MTDGISAIYRDQSITEDFERIIVLEENFLSVDRGDISEEDKTSVILLMKEWNKHCKFGMGYSAGPKRGTAREHILQMGRWLERKIDYDELRVSLNERVEEGATRKEFFHIPVGEGRNGKIAGNLEETLKLALERKFGGEMPHSFYTLVDEEGNISFEKLTCGDCPLAGRGIYCNGKQRSECNGYVKEEWARGKEKLNQVRNEIDRYCNVYKLSHVKSRSN